MITHRVSIRLAIVLVALSALAAGCQTKRQAYPGQDPEHVWTAMLAVARTPDYASGPYTERWTVRENHVWVDEQTNRIEIYRSLERILHQPLSPPLHETRDWKIRVQLERSDPPTVAFTARNVGVPAHAWEEAERYFTELQEVLDLEPESTEPAADERSTTPPPPPFDEPY